EGAGTCAANFVSSLSAPRLLRFPGTAAPIDTPVKPDGQRCELAVLEKAPCPECAGGQPGGFHGAEIIHAEDFAGRGIDKVRYHALVVRQLLQHVAQSGPNPWGGFLGSN